MTELQLFVDMDGVLADFDAHHEAVFGYRSDKLADNVDWKAIRQSKDFYLNIPPMADLAVLWNAIKDNNPIVLTGIPSSVAEAADNKRAWIRKHLGDVEVRCCLSREKYLHAKPGDILIDDWEKHKDLWVKAGGVWITHTSAKDTVARLRSIGLPKIGRCFRCEFHFPVDFELYPQDDGRLLCMDCMRSALVDKPKSAC